MIAVSSADAPVRRVKAEGYPEILFTNFVGDFAVDDGNAQGYLVEYTEAGGTIPPHFHGEDQWQVIIGGGGRLGKHDADPVVVHYTDGFTPYGPIVAGEEGIGFYTLRAHAYLGVHVMPKDRSEMKRPAQRALTISAGVSPGDSGSPDDQTSVESLLDEEDGVAAWTICLAPGESMTAPSPAGGGGQYHIVVNGAWLQGGKELPPKSVAFVDPGEPPAEYTAGADGLEIVVTQFPKVPTVQGLKEDAEPGAAGAVER